MSPATARLARAPQRPLAAPAPHGGQRRASRAGGRVQAPPRLRVLSAPVRVTWRPSFVAACAGVLVASLLAVLVINIVLSRGAYEEEQLELRQIALTESEQAISERLAVQSSPSTLSARARDLGMVPNASPAFIRLADGKVLGSPIPADPAKAAATADIPAASDSSVTPPAEPANPAAPGGPADIDAVTPATTAAADPPPAPADPPPAPPADPGDGAVPAGGTG